MLCCRSSSRKTQSLIHYKLIQRGGVCAGVIQLVCALLWRKNNNTNDFPMKCSAHNGTWTATSTVGFQVHITVQSMRHSGLDRPGRQTFLCCVHFVGDPSLLTSILELRWGIQSPHFHRLLVLLKHRCGPMYLPCGNEFQ